MAQDNFFQNLKKYQLTDLLLQIGNLSRKLFNANKSVEIIPINYLNGQFIRKGKTTITAWWLVDIAYYAIIHTNDFALVKPNYRSLISICNDYVNFDEKRSELKFGHNPTFDDVTNYLLGLSEKTFWYQELGKIREKFNRDFELLQVIPKQIKIKTDIENIILSTTGFSSNTFRKLLFAIFAVSRIKTDITNISLSKDLKKISPELTTENLLKVIDMFSADYNVYRTSNLGENQFIAKPIVKTLHSRYIAISTFLLARKIHDGLFWKIRDYYYSAEDKIKQTFTNDFGEIFEKYVKNLFSRYLSSKQYQRIPPDSKKRADWVFKSDKFTVLVEQKSTIMSLLLKTPYFDSETLKEYLNRLAESIIQLDKTESIYKEKNKITIKLVLLYEDLVMAENILREKLISKVKDKINNDKNYYLIYIGDFEHLVQILNEDPKTFDKILEYKINIADKKSSQGKEFYQIIPRFYKKENLYIKKELNHFKTFYKLF